MSNMMLQLSRFVRLVQRHRDERKNIENGTNVSGQVTDSLELALADLVDVFKSKIEVRVNTQTAEYGKRAEQLHSSKKF